MDKLFVNFLPPWVETNIQPAFYDKESGSVLQQTARMYAKVQCLVRMFNKLSKETKETVDEYIAKFVELKDFVDTYFENLDVQDEINNKLDEMAEDGTLTRIILDYLNLKIVWSYNTVADMVADESLVKDVIATTAGFHQENDGGGAKYLIIESTGVTTNGCNLIELDNGLVAQLLVTSPANVKQFGAVGDTNTDDTYPIQYALQADDTIYFPQGNYLITDTLSFENKTLIGAGEQLTGILGISEDASKPVIAMGGQSHLRNLHIGFKTSSLTGTVDDTNRIGIVLHGGYRDLALNSGSIRDVIIRNTYTAISDTGTKSPFSNTFENIFIEKFKQRGIFLSSGTRTGNVYNNIYLTNIGYVSKGNADTVTVRSGIRMVGEESECTMTQINIEHMTAYYPVYIENIKGLTITSMHLEGVRNESSNMPFVQLDKTQGVIDNISFYYTRHRTGQSLIRLGAVKETDTEVNKYGGKTALIINNLVCVGLNRPDYNIYGQGTAYPTANQTLGSSVITGFNFITRETSSDKYCLILNSYTWRTWSYIQDDSSYYETFASNPHNSIEWVKKSTQPISGAIADIPTSMRYAGMQYFDTASKKLLTYYSQHWYDGDGNQVV